MRRRVACNTEKTRVIHFSSKFIDTDNVTTIQIGDNHFRPLEEVCDLGIVFDKHLNMTTHITISVNPLHYLYATLRKSATTWMCIQRKKTCSRFCHLNKAKKHEHI